MDLSSSAVYEEYSVRGTILSVAACRWHCCSLHVVSLFCGFHRWNEVSRMAAVSKEGRTQATWKLQWWTGKWLYSREFLFQMAVSGFEGGKWRYIEWIHCAVWTAVD